MSIHANVHYDIRTTATQALAGGGFRQDASGVDYSQQDSPEWSETDIVADGSATITSATGGWTSDMVGNLIYLSNVFVRKEIITFTDENTIVVDSGVSAGSGITGYLGGAIPAPVDAFFESLTSGNSVYIQTGTYVSVANILVSKDGSQSNLTKIHGFKDTHGDNPTGDDRPLFSGGAYYVNFDDYYDTAHFRVTSAAAFTCFGVDNGGRIVNVKATQTTNNATYKSIKVGNTGVAIQDCEATNSSGSGIGISSAVTSWIVHGSYIHDLAEGIDKTGVDCCVITGNIFDTITDNGIDVATNGDNHWIINNTFYNCNNGISMTGTSSNANMYIVNNIFDSCTTYGVEWRTSVGNRVVLDYNNWTNNGDNVSDGVIGDNATTATITWGGAASGDFSNDLEPNAMPLTSFQGGLTLNALVQGAVQPAAGGGAAGTTYSGF